MLVDKQPPPREVETFKSLPAIRNWKPIHDQVLALHLAGYKNTVIAKRIDLTKERVCQVLKDPRAKKAITEFRDRMAVAFGHDIETRLVVLSDLALQRVAETLVAHALPGTQSKKHQDTTAFRVLEMAGYGAKKEERENDLSIKLSPEAENRIVEALEKSAEATKIYEMPLEEMEVEVVEDTAATG